MKKKYTPDHFAHVCQKGNHGNVLFYCTRDRLVYFTLFCTEAARFRIRPLALSLMFTHTHAFLQAANHEGLNDFVVTVGKRYAREFNRNAGLQGRVFLKPYVYSLKRQDKEINSCYIYIANNSAEKQLFCRAEEDRWTFLAYMDKVFPFSEYVPLRKASKAYRRSLSLVKGVHRQGKPLSYRSLERIFQPLDPRERERMTDELIQMYSVLDYEAALRRFGSYKALLQLVHTSSGADYDLKEEWRKESDIPYRKACRILRESGYDLAEKAFLTQPLPDDLLRMILRRSGLSPYQFERFFHLKADR